MTSWEPLNCIFNKKNHNNEITPMLWHIQAITVIIFEGHNNTNNFYLQETLPACRSLSDIDVQELTFRCL